MTVSPRLVPRVVLVMIATIAAIHLPGQERSPSVHPIIPVIGTVKSISGNQISVESGTRIIAVATDDHTEVWKGKIFHDLRWSMLATTLQVGAEQTLPADS